MVRAHGWPRRRQRGRDAKDRGQGDLARDRAQGHRSHGFLSALGQGALVQHDRQPARLVHLAPAQLGRAVALLHPQGHGRAASAHPRIARTRGTEGRARRHRGMVEGQCRRLSAGERSRGLCEGDRHPRRLVRFRHHPSHGDARLACRRTRLPGRSVSRRQRPAPRLVPFVLAHGLRARRPRALQRAADPRLHRGPARPQDEQVARQCGAPAGSQRQAWRRNHPALGRGHRLFGRVVDRR